MEITALIRLLQIPQAIGIFILQQGVKKGIRGLTMNVE
jgi:hypothetical protein